MAYFVIKNINGRDYLYRQESYREGGQVRSRSQYICPIDSAVAAQFKSTRSRFGVLDIKATSEDVREAEEARLSLRKAPETKSGSSGQSETSEPLVLWRELDGETKALWVDRKTGEVLREKASIFNTTISEKRNPADHTESNAPKGREKAANANPALSVSAKVEKHGISRTAVEGAYQRLLKQMEVDGFNTTNLPRIKIGYSISAKVEVYRRFSGGYRVTVPLLKRTKVIKALNKPADRRTKSGRQAPLVYQEPTKGVRSDFWREYRRALAFTYLDALERQNPEKFRTLKASLNPFYREHKAAIVSYIKNTNMKNKLGLTLQFKKQGNLSGWIKSRINAGGLGLPDHKPKTGWKADCAALMAEIHQRGLETTEDKYCELLTYAESTTRKATRELENLKTLDRLAGKARRQERAINRGKARERAVIATLKKLQTLKSLFAHDTERPDLTDDQITEEAAIRELARQFEAVRKEKAKARFVRLGSQRPPKVTKSFRELENARKRGRNGT